MHGVTRSKRPREILDELQAAYQARQEGNEGKARVCARRAAGWAITLHYEDDPGTTLPVSAYRVLQWFQVQEATPEALKQAAARLTAQINEDHDLPHPQDPLEDARALIGAMLADGDDRSEAGR